MGRKRSWVQPVWGYLKFPKEANEVLTRRWTELVEYIVCRYLRRGGFCDRKIPMGEAGSKREERPHRIPEEPRESGNNPYKAKSQEKDLLSQEVSFKEA